MNWLFTTDEVANAPSLKDSLDIDTERRYRTEGITYIRGLCDRLKLPHTTMSTACVLFHRFFMIRSFVKFSRWEIASASLFLAGKVEETPKKINSFYTNAKEFLNEMKKSEESLKMSQDKLLAHERIILQTLKFDLNVRQPYAYLLKMAKKLNGYLKKNLIIIKGDKDIINDIVQMAWSFLNDSLLLPLSIIYPPELIAISCLYLAYTTKSSQISYLIDQKEYDNDPEPAIELINSHSRDWWIECINEILKNSNDNFENFQKWSLNMINLNITHTYLDGFKILIKFNSLILDICKQVKTLYDENIFSIQTISINN